MKEGRKKAQVRPVTLMFWQKMPYCFFLSRPRKHFLAINNTKGWNPPPPSPGTSRVYDLEYIVGIITMISMYNLMLFIVERIVLFRNINFSSCKFSSKY